MDECAVLSRIKVAGLRQLAREHIQASVGSEVEDPIQLEFVWPSLRAADFVHSDVEREVLPETGGLDLDQSRAAIRIERLNVVTGAVAPGLRRPFDSLDEVAAATIM